MRVKYADMKPKIYFLGWLVIMGTFAKAQTSLNPIQNSESASARKVYAPKSSKTVKRKKPNVKHTAQYEFYERVEQAAKDKQRILRKLSKPQFSNPAYFGHKRKPKKRPPHRMRYCSECHIRH